MQFLTAVQANMNAIVAGRKMMTALPRDTVPATDRIRKIRGKMFVYSEKEK